MCITQTPQNKVNPSGYVTIHNSNNAKTPLEHS